LLAAAASSQRRSAVALAAFALGLFAIASTTWFWPAFRAASIRAITDLAVIAVILIVLPLSSGEAPGHANFFARVIRWLRKALLFTPLCPAGFISHTHNVSNFFRSWHQKFRVHNSHNPTSNASSSP
jgi:hypothetical protein